MQTQKSPVRKRGLKKSTQSGGRSERSDMTGRAANRITVGESPKNRRGCYADTKKLHS